MGTSVRRGTDKTVPTIARPGKSVDNYSLSSSGRRCGCDACHLAGSRGSPHAAHTSTTGGTERASEGGSARPPGEGSTVGQGMRRRSTPYVSIRWTRPRDPAHRQVSAPPAKPETAPAQAVSRLAARGSHLDHRAGTSGGKEAYGHRAEDVYPGRYCWPSPRCIARWTRAASRFAYGLACPAREPASLAPMCSPTVIGE